MLNKLITLATVSALVALSMPSKVDAYGAAHVGYTHVGPSGVYHTGRTAAYGPGGAYAGGRRPPIWRGVPRAPARAPRRESG